MFDGFNSQSIVRVNGLSVRPHRKSLAAHLRSSSPHPVRVFSLTRFRSDARRVGDSFVGTAHSRFRAIVQKPSKARSTSLSRVECEGSVGSCRLVTRGVLPVQPTEFACATSASAKSSGATLSSSRCSVYVVREPFPLPRCCVFRVIKPSASRAFRWSLTALTEMPHSPPIRS